MRIEVLELKRAFFCFPIRYSLILWGYVRLIYVAANILLEITDVELLREESIRRNIYRQVYTWTMILVDFILILIFIIGAHKKCGKLLKTFYFYDISLVIHQTLMSVAIIIYTIYDEFIRMINMYEASDVKIMLSFAPYVTSYLIVRGFVLLLVRIEIMKLSNNCQFRFVNNGAESECTMIHKMTDNEEQGLDVNYDETVESQDSCHENIGRLNDGLSLSLPIFEMEHETRDIGWRSQSETEIFCDGESWISNYTFFKVY